MRHRRQVAPLAVGWLVACGENLAVEAGSDAGDDVRGDATVAAKPGRDGGDGSATDAGLPRPCADEHDLCADFDDGPIELGFSAASRENGVLRAGEENYVSPPRSLRAEATTRSGGGGSIGPHLVASFSGAVRRVVLRGAFRRDAWENDTDVQIFTVELTTGEGRSYTTIVVGGGNGYLGSGGVQNDGGPTPIVAARVDELSRAAPEWVHVHLEIDTVGRNAILAIGGVERGRVALPFGGSAKDAVVRIGPMLIVRGNTAPDAGLWAGNFDDVIVDVER